MIQNTNYGASKTYVNTKVDKLTTSGLKAYTHDGATQGEIDVSNTYTPSTLALRDSNGRLFAADPASGATDKTLVTANWVSQTGDSAPNNLVHRTANETLLGFKYIPQLDISSVRASRTNVNGKTLILYDLGTTPGSGFNIQVNIEVNGRGHWRQVYIQIYDDNSIVRGENIIAGSTDGLLIIRRISDNHIYVGITGGQNDFPDVQIKYCHYRGTLRSYSRETIDITNDTTYLLEPIGNM